MKNFMILCLLSWASHSVAGWFDANENIFWQFRDQYVRIETQDVTTTPNQHPVKFSAEQIRHLLSALAVQRDTKNYSVFVESELQLLSEPIAKALAQARPEDDVSFVIVGMHPGVLTNENRVTTGRIFFQQQQLHVIFGLLHEEINEKQDRRLYPFTMASRTNNLSNGKWKMLTGAGQNSSRSDWISLSPKTVLTQVVSTLLLKPEQVAQETAQVRQETSRLNTEQRQLQENTQRLQQEVSELKQTVSHLKQPPIVQAVPEVSPQVGNVEQRLRTLQQLRQQNLITEQEYQQKRRKILEAL